MPFNPPERCKHGVLIDHCLDCKISWAELYLASLQSVKAKRLQYELSGAAPPDASVQTGPADSNDTLLIGVEDNALDI